MSEDITYLNGIKIFPVGMDDAIGIIIKHIPEKRGDYFCFLNVHLITESFENLELKEVLNKSSGNFPDGMGVAWTLKFLGYKFKDRVRGTDLMLKICEYASKEKLKIFLYGNTEKTLKLLKGKLTKDFKGIEIEYFSPPFRELTEDENKEVIEIINKANPDIVFVSLGAPKQEIWMAKHKGKIKAVQLGVGAAFDFITGNVKQAPIWMQRIGLEWLFRLPQQPRKTFYRMSLVPKFLWRLVSNFITKNS